MLSIAKPRAVKHEVFSFLKPSLIRAYSYSSLQIETKKILQKILIYDFIIPESKKETNRKMQARIVPALIIEDDTGNISDIFFSKASAELVLTINRVYAAGLENNDSQNASLDDIALAMRVVEESDLPKEMTGADRHYNYHKILTKVLTEMGEKVVGGRIDPGYFFLAVCCVIPGGVHGLSIAFSKEVMRQMFDDKTMYSPSSHVDEKTTKVLMRNMERTLVPFPEKFTELDRAFREMCRSMGRTNR